MYPLAELETDTDLIARQVLHYLGGPVDEAQPLSDAADSRTRHRNIKLFLCHLGELTIGQACVGEGVHLDETNVLVGDHRWVPAFLRVILVFPDGANRLRADFENSADFTHGAAFSK